MTERAADAASPAGGDSGPPAGDGGTASREQPVRVVVADDHPVVLHGTRAMLDHAPGISVLGLATTGAEAIELAATLRPDVLVLDVRLPDISGIEVARTLRGTLPELGILAFSAYDDPVAHDALVAAGVRGVLPKGAGIDELAGAVRTIARGGRWATSSRPRDAGQCYGLSQRERQVLALIAAGRRNAEIAGDLGLAPKTVEHHASRLFDRLGVRSRVEAAQLATRLGIDAAH